MTGNIAEAIQMGGVVLLIALYWGIRWVGGYKDSFKVVQLILRKGWHHILAGIVVGCTFLPFLRPYLKAVGLHALVFIAVWLGFVIGCGYDRHIKRRSSWMSLAMHSLQIVLAIAAVFLAYILFKGQLGMPSLNGAVALVVCGLCVIGGPGSSRFSSPLYERGTEPFLARGMGLVLLGCGLGAMRQIHFSVDLSMLGTGKILEINGLIDMALWSIALGAGIGMVADLLLRGVAVNRLFMLIAAVLALGGGVASHLGLEALWAGAIVGLWLINSTLRRRDILRMLERGDESLRTSLYLVSGCLLGMGVWEFGVQTGIFVWTLIVLGLLRPLTKWGSGGLLSALMGWQLIKKNRISLKGILDIDDLILALAAVFMGARYDAMGVSILAAVLVAQMSTHLVGIWWDGAGQSELLARDHGKMDPTEKVSNVSYLAS